MTDDPSFPSHPIRSSARRVPKEWIDYNGHMNVAYYTMAFDNALDEIYDLMGIGPSLVAAQNMGPMALQTQIHYAGELLEGERFACDFQLLDADAKRVHVFLEMRALDREEALAATYESLTLNVDLAARRGAPFPEPAASRVAALHAAHADLPRPPQVGARLGIRRKPA